MMEQNVDFERIAKAIQSTYETLKEKNPQDEILNRLKEAENELQLALSYHLQKTKGIQ